MTATCPRCDPRPIPDFPHVTLCDDCRGDLERNTTTAGPQRTPGKPWKATQAPEPAQTTDEGTQVLTRPQTGAHALIENDEWEQA